MTSYVQDDGHDIHQLPAECEWHQRLAVWGLVV